jgi:hypothetical protein
VAASRCKSQLALPPMEVTAVSPQLDRRGISVPLDDLDQVRALLRRAVADCGYTLDALEAAMGKVRTYIHKVLQGEKPLSYEFIVALPDDVEARFEQLRAEHFGHIVVAPVDTETAKRHLVTGLLGLLTKAS